MNTILIANAIALIASLLMVYTGYIKKKEKILFFQTIQIGLSVISNLILGGITGAIINALGLIRNILCYKEKLNKMAQIILIILSILLGVYFNNLALIGLLPIISNVVYIVFMNIKDVIKFKYNVLYSCNI